MTRLNVIANKVQWAIRRFVAFVTGQRKKSKLGIQWQEEGEEVKRYNRLVQPTVLKGINSRTREFWMRLKADNPDALLIYRHYPNFGWRDDPELRAIRAVTELRNAIGIPEHHNNYLLDIITHVEDNNEYIHAHMAEDYDAADRYMSAFMREVWARFGLGVVFGNFATGNFSEDTLDAFPLAIATAIELNQDKSKPSMYLGVHEYDAPTMDRTHLEDIAKGGQGYWHCGRWKRIMAPIKEKYGPGPLQCVITEMGVDFGVLGQHGKGWRSISTILADALASYVGEHSLCWYNQLVEEDEDVAGCCIFILNGQGDWSDFEIGGTEIPNHIAQMPAWEPEPEPPEPNGGGEPMDIRVIDLEQKERDFEYAKAKYGVAFKRASVEPGQLVYRLVELWEKTGYHSLITQVLNQQGQPMENVDVTFYWPDAPDPPDPPTEVYPHDWYRNFVHGPTNENGDVGPGMGRGAYHGEGEGGPHAVWLRDPNVPSDICEKLGMLAGTNHDHLDQKFQLVIEGGNGDGEPPDGDDGRFEIVGQPVYIAGGAENYIRLVSTNHNLIEMYGNLTCGYWEIEDLVSPREIDGQPTIEFTCTYIENEDRDYEAFIVDRRTMTTVGGPFVAPLKANERGTWTFSIKWITGEDPGPGPAPDGGIVEAVLMVAQSLEQAAMALRTLVKYF